MRNSIERDLNTDGVEIDGIETRKYNRMKRGKFRIQDVHELGGVHEHEDR